MKRRGEKSPRREEKKKEDLGRERVRRQKMQVREKVEKSRNTIFFQWFVAPEGRKVGSLKRRVRSHVARWEMKNCTPLWREAHFEVKMYKPHHSRTTSGSWDVEKVHAVVARSTFRSENVQNTSVSDHVWKLRMSKSKYTKHTILGPLLEVEMSKKCAPLWREAHVQVKSKKLRGTEHFWTFRCHFAWQAQGIVCLVKSEETWGFWSSFKYNHHYTTLHHTTLLTTATTATALHYTTLHYTNYTTLHSASLRYTTRHSIALHYNYN